MIIMIMIIIIVIIINESYGCTLKNERMEVEKG